VDPNTREPTAGAYAITKRGRFWAVTDASGALVCVCVYRRGAVEVVRRLDALSAAGNPAPVLTLREQWLDGFEPPEAGRKPVRGASTRRGQG
jgi:hypothetical protein